MSVVININDQCCGNAYTEWDMSTDKFPTGSVKGQKYYGINGPTTYLLDRRSNSIPSDVWLISLKNNASETDPLEWSIQYTIN